MTRNKTAMLVSLLLISAFSAAAQETEDGRGYIVYRMGEKYEVYAYEKKLPSALMRKYTYIIEGNEAGYDTVYVCSDSQTAITQRLIFLKELSKTGKAAERAFNTMSMKLWTAENEAYINEVLFMRPEAKKWRVSLSNTLRIYEKEIAMFRMQYEFE